MSTNRTSRQAGWVDPRKLPKGPNGRNLCRQCGEEVPKGRRTFCSDECVDLWKIKTDPGHVRIMVFRRDQGVCASCGIDTTKIKGLMREILDRSGEVLGVEVTPYVWSQSANGFIQGIKDLLPRNRTTFWDADHIIPVVEGGGECDLDNYRTLCYWCHQRVTAELARRRAKERKRQKGLVTIPGLDLDKGETR